MGNLTSKEEDAPPTPPESSNEHLYPSETDSGVTHCGELSKQEAPVDLKLRIPAELHRDDSHSPPGELNPLSNLGDLKSSSAPGDYPCNAGAPSRELKPPPHPESSPLQELHKKESPTHPGELNSSSSHEEVHSKDVPCTNSNVTLSNTTSPQPVETKKKMSRQEKRRIERQKKKKGKLL